jgi:hypothetical protein
MSEKKLTYDLDYNFCEGSVLFEVDKDKFLNEVIKKYALEALRLFMLEKKDKDLIIHRFMNDNSFCRLDGEDGILLKDIATIPLHELEDLDPRLLTIRIILKR